MQSLVDGPRQSTTAGFTLCSESHRGTHVCFRSSQPTSTTELGLPRRREYNSLPDEKCQYLPLAPSLRSIAALVAIESWGELPLDPHAPSIPPPLGHLDYVPAEFVVAVVRSPVEASPPCREATGPSLQPNLLVDVNPVRTMASATSTTIVLQTPSARLNQWSQLSSANDSIKVLALAGCGFRKLWHGKFRKFWHTLTP